MSCSCFRTYFGRSNLAVIQAVILRQFNHRLKPELRLPVWMMHVHVEPGFLARKEEEPEPILAENRRAQEASVRQLIAIGGHLTVPASHTTVRTGHVHGGSMN